jgi:membrane protein implicated in regulation of membrane protease activity
VFSGAPEMGGDVDVSGGGVHVGGHDVAPGDSLSLSPVSPVTIAMFIASFGGTGLILKKLAAMPMYVHLPAAMVSGFVVAGAVFLMFAKVMRATQASSHASADEVVGSEAEVLTAIPAEGVGEIAYTARGSRMNAPAKTVDGKELPAHAIVKIVKVVGGTYIVEKPRA